MSGSITICEFCERNHGSCINDTCICHEGFLGIVCQDPVTTTIQTVVSQINAASIVASIFGGALFTLIVGLIIYLIWKHRSNNKSYTFSSTTTPTTTANVPSSQPIVVPALYNLSSSYRAFSLASARTESYHLYDELH